MTPQEHYLGLIYCVRPKVAESLIAASELWRSVMMDSSGLRVLRDLPYGINNADRLWLTPVQGREQELYALVQGWKPEEFHWVPKEEAQHLLGLWVGITDKSLLRAWWD